MTNKPKDLNDILSAEAFAKMFATTRPKPGACIHGSTSVICSRCDAELIAAHEQKLRVNNEKI